MTKIFADILIIADDLSGAADCAIACVQAGLESLVVLDGDDAATPGAEALAIDTDSRRLSPAAAADATARVLRQHAGPGTLVFKKIDSTLRGNAAVEIAAGLAVIRERDPAANPTAIVAPAFPGAGRTTRAGCQLVNGTPVEETEIWRNEGIAGRAHIPSMLAAAGLRVGSIDLATIRDPARLALAFAAGSRNHDALVCDAEADADLQAIADAGQNLGRSILWAGSAGIAAHLPRAAGLTRPPGPAATAASRRDGAVICLVGSLSGISRDQFKNLTAADGIVSFEITPEVLRAGPGDEAWIGQSARIGDAIAAGQDIALLLGADANPDHAEGLALCRALGRLIAAHVSHASGLIATGGETARAVLQALDVAALRLVGQVEPGIPLSLIVSTGAHGGLRMITKAGAFGGPDTLTRCRAVLRAGVTPAFTS